MRLEGWEGRLQALVEDARGAPYELGTHDCFRMACRVVEALTGVDRWAEFPGYRTRREALALIARHGHNFEEAFDWFFGQLRQDTRRARRGDLVAIQTPDGEKHLGVCLGTRTAFLSASGLVFLDTAECICCWAVG